MATRKKRRTAGRRKTDSRLPGWIYMLMGLSVGLAVAAGIYVSDRQQPTSMLTSPAAPPAEAPAPEPAQPPPAPRVVDPEPEDTVTFDFYDMLPNLDVEVFEDAQPPTRPTPAPPRVETPGIYILQAGSFTTLTDANRRKAEMGLLGVRSEIKKGSANGRTVYRVYTDPMDNLNDVNLVSRRLQNAGIEILLKRVSD